MKKIGEDNRCKKFQICQDIYIYILYSNRILINLIAILITKYNLT